MLIRSSCPGSFLLPLSLSLDQSSHTLYVSDRENGRDQSITSFSRTFVDETMLPGFGGKFFPWIKTSVNVRVFVSLPKKVSFSWWFLLVSLRRWSSFSRGWSTTRCRWTKSEKSLFLSQKNNSDSKVSLKRQKSPKTATDTQDVRKFYWFFV